LPNGLRVIVQPESVSDTVSVFGLVKNRPKVQEPPGQEGVASALSELFDFGTTRLDRLAFQMALDEIGGIESAGADFSLQVLASDFDRGAQLLAENMISPALPEPALKILQPQLAAAVAGELKSPGYLANRALEKTLFPTNDPVRREATPKTVKSLNIQDVRDYYENAFRPDLTTIVVIGNLQPKLAEAVISKYFGPWKSEGPKPNTLLPPAPNNQPAIRDVPDASRTQDKVTLGQTLKLVRTNDDYYALELGNHVLGGGFYATRLYRDLRENNGLVYFVSSQFQVGETRGAYLVTYACDPPNVGRARAIVESNLRQMQQTNVSAPELNQARTLLLREIPLSESSTERIAKAWLQRSELGLPLDEDIRAAHRYLELDANAVRTAFAKWIRPGDLVQVTQGPSPR
jgi:zinc protease